MYSSPVVVNNNRQCIGKKLLVAVLVFFIRFVSHFILHEHTVDLKNNTQINTACGIRQFVYEHVQRNLYKPNPLFFYYGI